MFPWIFRFMFNLIPKHFNWNAVHILGDKIAFRFNHSRSWMHLFIAQCTVGVCVCVRKASAVMHVTWFYPFKQCYKRVYIALWFGKQANTKISPEIKLKYIWICIYWGWNILAVNCTYIGNEITCKNQKTG